MNFDKIIDDIFGAVRNGVLRHPSKRHITGDGYIVPEYVHTIGRDAFSKEKWKSHTNNYDINLMHLSNVHTISSNAFCGNNHISQIDGHGVKKVEYCAFYDSVIDEIRLPHIERMERGAIQCSKIGKLVVNDLDALTYSSYSPFVDSKISILRTISGQKNDLSCIFPSVKYIATSGTEERLIVARLSDEAKHISQNHGMDFVIKGNDIQNLPDGFYGFQIANNLKDNKNFVYTRDGKYGAAIDIDAELTKSRIEYEMGIPMNSTIFRDIEFGKSYKETYVFMLNMVGNAYKKKLKYNDARRVLNECSERAHKCASDNTQYTICALPIIINGNSLNIQNLFEKHGAQVAYRDCSACKQRNQKMYDDCRLFKDR